MPVEQSLQRLRVFGHGMNLLSVASQGRARIRSTITLMQAGLPECQRALPGAAKLCRVCPRIPVPAERHAHLLVTDFRQLGNAVRMPGRVALSCCC